MPPTSRQFLASPSAPSDVFTIHTIDSRSPPRQLVPAIREREGRPPCPPLGDTIDTTSPPPRHRSTSNQKGSAAGCLSSCPPRPLPRPLPFHQVVRIGQRASQGGRSPPAHPADPLHHAGVPRHIGGHLRRGGGQRGAISGRQQLYLYIYSFSL